jgi:hypothetical protein
MARTFRRRRERHEYRWVLRTFESRLLHPNWVKIDPRSKLGRKAIALFHSDKIVTMGPPRLAGFARCPTTAFVLPTIGYFGVGSPIPRSTPYFAPGTSTTRIGPGGDPLR